MVQPVEFGEKALCILIPPPYLVVHPVEVGEKALVVPPASVGNLGADVPGVGCAEAPLVVVPGKGILHRPAEPVHVQAVIVCLVLNPASKEGWTFSWGVFEPPVQPGSCIPGVDT